MIYYSQINENNTCVGISALSGVINHPQMIEITAELYSGGELLGKKYVDGEWQEVEEAASK